MASNIRLSGWYVVVSPIEYSRDTIWLNNHEVRFQSPKDKSYCISYRIESAKELVFVKESNEYTSW